MIDLFGELKTTVNSLCYRKLAISYAIDAERERLMSVGFIPNALTIEDAKVLEIPEISAYYLLAQIAGQDTTQSIPELLSQFEAWHILAETTLSKMEKN